jgi:GT2 family glycosyltransferase
MRMIYLLSGILTSDCIPLLLGFKKHYDLAVVGPLILDKKLKIQSAGDRVGENSIHHIGTGLDPRYGLGTRTAMLNRQVSSVTGAFFSIRKQLYKSLGGFDESLASAYQDVVFCNKVRSAGMNLAIYANTRVKHLEGVTRGKSISPHEKAIAFSRLEESLSSKDPFGFYQFSNDQLILKRIYSLIRLALLQILRKVAQKLTPRKRVSVQETEVA